MSTLGIGVHTRGGTEETAALHEETNRRQSSRLTRSQPCPAIIPASPPSLGQQGKPLRFSVSFLRVDLVVKASGAVIAPHRAKGITAL